MKLNIKYWIPALLMTCSLSSCNDYLDVQPQGTLVERVMFKDVQGFRDAMYGAYASMAKEDLYGKNLSWGFADQIGQMFVYDNVMNVESHVVEYDYLNKDVRKIIDDIWFKQYETISYVNNIIYQCGITKLKDPDLKLIEGEAYALRAFMHLDLMRLFAPRYGGNSQRSVPYAMDFSLNNKPLFSPKETYQHILDDLDRAETLLSQDDNIWGDENIGSDVTYSDYRKQRYAHCNKYAVWAVKARTYYAMGDLKKAGEYAKMVIDNKNFQLPKASDFNSVRHYPSKNELIFGLNTKFLSDVLYNTFLKQKEQGNTVQGRDDLYDLYGAKQFTSTNTDLRYDAFYKLSNGNKMALFTRYLQNEGDIKNHPVTGISLIRLPEMYYILSESLYDTDKDAALKYLNMVRASRGLEPMKKEEIAQKGDYVQVMLAERMKEFPGEGQVFYSLKMYNIPFKKVLRGNDESVMPSDKVFVLPLPEAEKDYGINQN